MRISIAAMMLTASNKGFTWSVPFTPDQTIVSSPDHQGTIQLLLWAVKAAVLIACTTLLIIGSKHLADENYYQASLSLTGAIIAGGATYYALPLS